MAEARLITRRAALDVTRSVRASPPVGPVAHPASNAATTTTIPKEPRIVPPIIPSCASWHYRRGCAEVNINRLFEEGTGRVTMPFLCLTKQSFRVDAAIAFPTDASCVNDK